VTGSGERAVTRQDFVDGAFIDACLGEFTVLHGLEVNHGHLDEEFLWITIFESFGSMVPLASFQVDTVDVATCLRLSLYILVGHGAHDDMGEADLIDSNCVLSSVVLLSTREESLREEESRNPEDIGSSIVKPLR